MTFRARMVTEMLCPGLNDARLHIVESALEWLQVPALDEMSYAVNAEPPSLTGMRHDTRAVVALVIKTDASRGALGASIGNTTALAVFAWDAV